MRPAFDQAALQLERALLSFFRSSSWIIRNTPVRHDQVIRTFVKACVTLSHAENSDEVRQWVERLEAR